VQPADDRSSRASLTTIYFLLAAGQHSRWHRVRSDEVWHFYEGDPIELLVADPELLQVERVRLGPVPDGMRPVYVVPAGWWQAARPTGAYGLVGCTVAPGFEFDDFSFLRDDPEMFRAIRLLDPRLVDLA
jgi:predicted cupin superfamily sugar epimerase